MAPPHGVGHHTSPTMVSLPTAGYVILGMLGLGEGSGYDVKRRVHLSTRYFAMISDAQIYPLLDRLEGDGLVVGCSEPRGRRRRRVYALTEAGEQVLREWVGAEDPLALEMRDVGLLKLFFADALEPPQALAHVRAMKARSQRILGELRRGSAPAAGDLGGQGRRFPLHALGFGIAMHEAWVVYCDALEAELTEQSKSMPGIEP